MAVKRALRYAAQPTKQAGDAWSYWNLVFPFVPAPLAALAIGYVRSSPITGVWVLALGISMTAAALLLVAAIRLAHDVETYEAVPRPHLTFVGVDHARAMFFQRALAIGTGPAVSSTATSYGVSTDTPPVHDFVRVNIANDPPPGVVGALAVKVVGRVSFIRTDGTVAIDRMLGRWAETPRRAETGRVGISLDEVQLDIEPNGLSHPLDIAMKRTQDASLYAVNDESSSAPEFCLPKHELPDHDYLVDTPTHVVNG